MEVIITITAEVPDSVFDMFGADAVARAFRQQVNADRPNFLPDLVASYGVTVEVPESDGDALPERPTTRVPVRAATAVSKPHTASTDGERRIGRPKTLDGYAASDGGPVREWGTRSPDELRKAGVKVYRPKGSGSQHAEPEVQESAPEPTVRKAAKKGTTPVVLRRR